MFFTAVTLGLLASFVPSNGQEFNLNNYCDKDVWFWDVGGLTSAPTLIPVNDYQQVYLDPDPVTKGKDIFVSFSNTTDISLPTLHISYDVDGDWQEEGHVLWYAMANINGVPFKGHRVRIDGPSCPEVLWKDGEGKLTCISLSGDSGVKNCPDAQYMDLRLCVENP
ncbi:hypothetical protein P280DRAFT_468169 [Massarina eburnea CBS 473.64]|uniref:Uncharacterized protein n=1 Tax=Massarina eburnea CBS 473.64 TaxID=1395130 RepID=A0A6A6S9K3_9PLEO|nr:hypothetical protein P280DRAFT_468169 [Massarina eburnea CBS 473.64]